MRKGTHASMPLQDQPAYSRLVDHVTATSSALQNLIRAQGSYIRCVYELNRELGTYANSARFRGHTESNRGSHFDSNPYTDATFAADAAATTNTTPLPPSDSIGSSLIDTAVAILADISMENQPSTTPTTSTPDRIKRTHDRDVDDITSIQSDVTGLHPSITRTDGCATPQKVRKVVHK